MKIRFNIKGETLVETIIALSILAVGITVASTVVLNSIRNLTNAKNRVVAVNIAREGIEAVRSIRDTNWLFYSDRRRQCWNHDPSKGACDGTYSIAPGTYIVYKSSDKSWRLLAESPFFDLTPLSLMDMDPDIDSDNADKDNDEHTNTNDDPDFYNHRVPAPFSNYGTWVKATPYSRYVTIEYLSNAPILPYPNDSIKDLGTWTTTGDQETYNRMRVTSVVKWKLGINDFTTELETILTDHLGREDLET